MKFVAVFKLRLACILVFFFFTRAFAQTTKEFVTADGKPTTDSTNAQMMLLIDKVSDTAYRVHQYDMKHILLAEGIFKDAQLTNSNGEFIYYKVEPGSTRLAYHYDIKKIDTIRTLAKLYVASKGKLLNGLKYGIWTEFFSNGSPQYINTLRADTTNGVSKIFYPAPDFYLHYDKNDDLNAAAFKFNNLAEIQANYINGRREGAWYSISRKGDTIGVDYYKNNKEIKSISYLSEKRFQTHVKPGYPGYDLGALLNRKISTQNSDYNQGTLIIDFTLSKEGALNEPLVENLNDDLELDRTVIATLLSFPAWKPAFIDNNAVQSKIEITIHYEKKAGERYKFTVDPGISYNVSGYNGY